MFSILQTQKKGRNFPISFAHSHLFIKFASILRHSGGLDGRTFKQKGVIEIIFDTQTSQLWKWNEDDGSSTTSWFVQPLLASYISNGVGYCFIHSIGSAKTRVWDKADIVPTPYLLY